VKHNGLNVVSMPPSSATAEIGLIKGYSREVIDRLDIIGLIKEFQKTASRERSVFLGVSFSDTVIVLNEQAESHLRLGFVNYPRFPLPHNIFKAEVVNCVSYLMEKSGQNRTVILFNDETVMLEKSHDVDPGVLSY